MTSAFFETVLFLWSHFPLTWFAPLVFGAIGYWYGYICWYVSERRLEVLACERDRLASSVAQLRQQLASHGGEELVRRHEKEAEDFDDFTVLPGIDIFACAKLHQSGIHHFTQLEDLEEMSEDELETFRLSFGIGRFDLADWRWTWDAAHPPPENCRSPLAWEPEMIRDRELGYIFSGGPEHTEDLDLIRGLNTAMREVLNSIGIHHFRQIASWNSLNIAVMEERLSLQRDTIEEKEWIKQAEILAGWAEGLRTEHFAAPTKVDHALIVEREFCGQLGIRIDPNLGIVYDFQPEVTDDLCEISGISEELAPKLNELGIYRHRQIANWTQQNAKSVSTALEISQEEVEAKCWIPQAGFLDRETYSGSRIWSSSHPPSDEVQRIIERDFPGETVKFDEDFGIVYRSRPDHADELGLLGGLNLASEFALNAAGVWCFKQIASWSAGNVEAFAERLQMDPDRIYRLRWISKARQLACAESNAPKHHEFARASRDLLMDGAHFDERFGLIFEREPGNVDDLKLIRGVGPKLEQTLREFGVYRYHQIALWTPEIARQFSESCPGFNRRLFTEQWQEQAKALHEQRFLRPISSRKEDVELSSSDLDEQ